MRTAVRLAKLYAYLWFAKALGAKLVWTAHNLYPHEGFDREFHRIGRRIITSLASYVCVHGPSSAEIVERELKVAASRIRIGHHGHWLGHYPNQTTRAQSRVRLNLPAEEFVYLFIGACRPYKGLESLIEAFAVAPRPARLLIAGKFTSPHYLNDIWRLVRETPSVELVPTHIPDDELQLYLNAADCVVLPYRAILTSGTAMLAMSFGRPVVAPDLGGIADNLDFRCGLLYDADEPQGLASALRQIRALSFDSETIIENARRFGWSQLASALLNAPGESAD
jgi:glycosyltransferase involved in cell wall biosynthesis